MRSRCLIATVLLTFAVSGRAADAPPDITLTVPQAFATALTIRHLRAGEDVLNSPPYRLTTVAPMTEYWGWFGPKDAPQADDHRWRVRVYATSSRKVAAAYASATNGFQADLNEAAEFLKYPEKSYMYARFERKHFRWGDAVSFFSQFTQDTGMYVPHNGHLTYEVWGLTRDQRYTVVAHLAVSHPKLADWGPDVRDARSIEALKRDRDYKLVERCSPEQFEPNLTSFDRMLDTLVIR
jgi:hypothetical protein